MLKCCTDSESQLLKCYCRFQHITMSFCDTLLYIEKLEEVCVASASCSSKDVLVAKPGLWSSWSLRESFWLESRRYKSTNCRSWRNTMVTACPHSLKCIWCKWIVVLQNFGKLCQLNVLFLVLIVEKKWIYLVWITVTLHLSCCHRDSSLSLAVTETPLPFFSSLWLKQRRVDHMNVIYMNIWCKRCNGTHTHTQRQGEE